MALCSSPYHVGSVEVRCGRCMPCRVYRRRIWTARAVLEMACHRRNSFITLTYSNDKLPAGGSLSPRDAKLFCMRMRKALGPYRYLLVGEYGDRTWRPHYHMLCFGLSPAPDAVQELWSLGYTDVRPASLESASYAAGYVIKKMTAKDDPRLEGRYPEFIRVSLKPGLGAQGLKPMVDWYRTSEGAKYIAEHRDVIKSVRIGAKLFPLGVYLVNKLRDALDIPRVDPLRMFELNVAEAELRRSIPDYLELRSLKRKAQAASFGRLRLEGTRRVL